MGQLSLFEPIEIPLTRGFVALVDPIDADLAERRWHPDERDKCTYAQSSFGLPRMHRVIMSRILCRELNRFEFVDHVNRNGLDNRRTNLRLASPAESVRNRGVAASCKSGFKGAYYRKDTINKWAAEITINKKHVHLGRFATPEEAYAVYCKAAKENFGEFASLEERQNAKE